MFRFDLDGDGQVGFLDFFLFADNFGQSCDNGVAKGLAERVVVVRHALRNTLIPVVTVAGVSVGRLLGGAVVVETVFGWPGLGTLTVTGILERDFPLVQGSVLFIATTFVLVNFLVDMLYAWIDPRIRYT